ncbi:PIG-L family deacetylase [Umezawaea beigongshangensis]|uniref:PIG-L family deacetylase n=1 Tax=Umezawaea beigongshangensis TaxID=2780383 RepID=UPI0018F19297|nr:PIG-L family deacetylase [Umezawaea beigongshangensis]
MTAPIERNTAVVAHEDDDLIFINPDVQLGVQRGAPTRTVYVTAGEFNGNGTTRELYAAQRRAGVCAAYASMAGVADRWTRTSRTFAGRAVEVDVLVGAPHVELVFLGLPDGGDSLQLDALTRLWDDAQETAHTIVYPGSPVQQSLVYTGAGLTAVLVALLADSAPTAVFAQDPEPDPRDAPDHADHVACARFARAAFEIHATGTGTRPLLVEHRGYGTQGWAQNLSQQAVSTKSAVYGVYAAQDSGAGSSPLVWLRSQYWRWPAGTAWAGKDGGGRTHVFSAQGGAVRHWRQQTAGGAFTGPVSIGGGPVAPSLAVGSNQDGRVEVFAVDLETHDVVTSYQTSVGGGFSAWESLGNPNGESGQHTGAPAVGKNADGRLQVFVKNSGGGVSTAYQTEVNAGFSGWEDFGGGPDVRGTPVCVRRPDGRLALFAATRTGVLRWWQATPSQGWGPVASLVGDAVTSSPTAALNADGRLEVFWRGEFGDVRTVYEFSVGGSWSGPPTGLGSPGGVGEVAALRASGAQNRIFLAARDATGGVSFTRQVAPNDGFGSWSGLVGTTPVSPALVTNSAGQPIALRIGTDGRLLVSPPLP